MTTLNQEQIKAAMSAGLEVLNGAPPARILELTEPLALCKHLLGMFCDGKLLLAVPAPVPAGSPANGEEAAKPADAKPPSPPKIRSKRKSGGTSRKSR